MIDAANIEILRIQESNPNEVEELNYWWDKIGTQLWLEQRAIPFSVPKNESIYQSAGREEIDSFIRSAEEYAQNTDYCDTAPILEAISDLNNIGGQSIVAGAREARNARRLVNTGGETDNDVPDVLNVAQATAVADIATGAVVSISVTAPGSGYVVPPNVTIIPQEGVFGTCGNTENALNSSDDCSFVASIEDYPNILNVKPGWTTTIGTVTGTVLIDTSYKITVNAGCFKPDTVYTFVGPPCPPGQGCVAVCVLDPNGSVAEIRVTEPGSGYCCAPLVVIDEPPQPPKIGDPIVPGSNSGSDYTGQDPVPDILVTGDDSSYTVPEAIEEVTTCNCDCWK
jgi:hypothetical protein